MSVRAVRKTRASSQRPNDPEPRLCRVGWVVAAVAIVLVLAACRGEAQGPVAVEGGDADRGRELIIAYECGECHRIPGIEDAQGRTAPSLNVWPNRAFVAESMRNTPENTAAFIMEPERYVPGIDMPNAGMSEQEALDITAYLFTLR